MTVFFLMYVRAPRVQKRKPKKTSSRTENKIYEALRYLAFNGHYNTIYDIHANIENFAINIVTFYYGKKYSLILRTFAVEISLVPFHYRINLI